VVPICFKDYKPSMVVGTLFENFFGEPVSGFPYESLRSFYKRSSYDALNITGAVRPWYKEPGKRSDVMDDRPSAAALMRKALRKADSDGVNFRRYDVNGDGRIDDIVFVWAGPAVDGGKSIWWSRSLEYVGWSGKSLVLDGKTVGECTWMWTKDKSLPWPMVRTAIHETGHALGLTDYYDYQTTAEGDTVGPDGGVGEFDMMDHNWGDHNCFSKLLLGWIEPTAVYWGEDKTVTLRPSGTNRDALIVFPRGGGENLHSEFFMVQNRTRILNDAKGPGDGLLIWHVDAALNAAGNGFAFNNTHTSHKLLRLMEADGLEEIEQGKPANAGDYYRPGGTIGPETRPSLQLYDGTSTALWIGDIAQSGSQYSVHVGAKATESRFVVQGQHSFWTDTELDVPPNSIVTLSADGRITWDPNVSEPTVGPQGASWTPSRVGAPWEFLLPNDPIAGLIGQIGAGAFFIGTSRTTTSTTGGRLQLGLNERWKQGCWDDNSGSFNVQVSVSPRTSGE
jgi:M6 family metalloprotease-like protein